MEDNQELVRMFTEDQADRISPEGKPAGELMRRDGTRLTRVKQLYQNSQLRTGTDYYHAAMILQHGVCPEDYLLAHELCIVAISKGYESAKWLAAASEDRFLMNIDRPQRFGTQSRSDGPNSPMRLYPVDPNVTDELRRAFDVPPLAQTETEEGV